MNHNFIIRYNNNLYDLSNFIDKHPGGNIILQAFNYQKNIQTYYDNNNFSDNFTHSSIYNLSNYNDIIDIWKKYNVEWHLNSSNVLTILNKYKINLEGGSHSSPHDLFFT